MPFFLGTRHALLGGLKSNFPKCGVLTTTSPQTVTVQKWKCIEPTVIVWGDGSTTNHAASNGGTVSHDYATAGNYVITFRVNPTAVREIDFRTAALQPNTAWLRRCTGVTHLLLQEGLITLDSAPLQE